MRSLPVVALLAALVALAGSALAQTAPRKATDHRGARTAPAVSGIRDASGITDASGVAALVRPAVERVGGLTFYATRDAFDADNPGLPIEDFEDIHITNGISCWSFSPVDEDTDDECYDPGTLTAPLGLAARGPTQHVEDALIALGAGYFGQPSTVVGANLEVDTTEVWFEPDGVSAVGMKVYAFFGNPGITVDVYDTGGNLLGSTTIPGSTAGTFFGVTGGPIGAIRLDADEDYTMVDDVAYGTTAVGVEPLPEQAPFAFSVRPNPASGAGTVTLTLARPMRALLLVRDALGREVAVLLDGALGAGRHEVRFDGSSLPPGAYLLTLEAEGHVRTHRVTLAR